MRRACTLIAVLFLIPSIASAQPAPDATPKDDSIPTESVHPQATPGEPQSEAVPPESEPVTDAETHQRGFTAEVSVGLSVLFDRDTYSIYNEQRPGLALGLGAGYFVNPRVALGLRATDYYAGLNVGVVGPHAQIWLRPDVWLGAGIGVGFLGGGGYRARVRGFPSFDARLGVPLGRFNISLEIARIEGIGPIGDGYSLGKPSYLVDIMFGYQRL